MINVYIGYCVFVPELLAGGCVFSGIFGGTGNCGCGIFGVEPILFCPDTLGTGISGKGIRGLCTEGLLGTGGAVGEGLIGLSGILGGSAYLVTFFFSVLLFSSIGSCVSVLSDRHPENRQKMAIAGIIMDFNAILL